jgi:hypothetical protein
LNKKPIVAQASELIPVTADIKTQPVDIGREDISQSEKDIISTMKGGSILMIGRLVTYGSRLVIAFVLARLLAAEQFGLYSWQPSSSDFITWQLPPPPLGGQWRCSV